MRLLLLSFLCFMLVSSMKSDNKDTRGVYSDYFGSTMRLYGDSTFHYEWHFDLSGSWSRGIWQVNNDTILFNVIPVYDTIEVYANHRTFDRLVLSGDSVSDRKYYDTLRLNDGNQLIRKNVEFTKQNSRECPAKLMLRKGRLYWICANGKPCTKRIKGFWTRKKYPPYFVKQ